MRLDVQSYASLLNSFNSSYYISQGKQLHLLFLKNGILNGTLTVANRVLQMYCRCGEVGDARKLFDDMSERNCFTWNTLLEGYVHDGKMEDLLNSFHLMPHRNDFSWNLVISGLVKAGELDVAQRLFWDMPRKNGMALNSLVHGYVRSGRPDAGLKLFKDCWNWRTSEIREGLLLDSFVFATLVGACANLEVMQCGKQIHARIIVDGVEVDLVLGSSIVNMYAKCGDLEAASHAFSSMPNQDDFSLSALISGYANSGRLNDAKNMFSVKTDPSPVLWNSMIAGCITNNEVFEAFQLFNNMWKEGIAVDFTTFTCIFSSLSSLGDYKSFQQLHSLVNKLGFLNDVILASALIDAYAKCGRSLDACSMFSELNMRDTVLLNSMITVYSNCGRIKDAKNIFDNMECKSLVSWNSIIAGLTQNGCPLEALNIFCKMNRARLSIDKFSLASVISACASITSVEFGEQIFARATIIGLDFDQIVLSSLVDFYCKCGFLENGRRLFNQQQDVDAIAWNSMLMGYATNGCGIETLDLFHQMRCAGITPTNVTFIAVLSACDHCGLVEEAQKWFCALKHFYGIDPTIEHYSCMIDLYARAGCLNEALNLIEDMPFKADASMWLSILRGCVAHGDRHLGKKVAEQVMELDSENSSAFVQLSNIFSTSGEWQDSAIVRKLMKDRNIQKNPGQSWGTTT